MQNFHLRGILSRRIFFSKRAKRAFHWQTDNFTQFYYFHVNFQEQQKKQNKTILLRDKKVKYNKIHRMKSTTVLTNLQRGNIEAKIKTKIELTFFERCAQGKIYKT